MLRIAVQSKGRLYDETMMLLEEAGIKLNRGKRILLLSAKGFPVEVLFLRDDDIPQSVANGVADIGIVGENEYVENFLSRDPTVFLGGERREGGYSCNQRLRGNRPGHWLGGRYL